MIVSTKKFTSVKGTISEKYDMVVKFEIKLEFNDSIEIN